MSLLRALRAYVGLGPDEDYEVGRLAPSPEPHQEVEGRSMTSSDKYWSYGADGDSQHASAAVAARRPNGDQRSHVSGKGLERSRGTGAFDVADVGDEEDDEQVIDLRQDHGGGDDDDDTTDHRPASRDLEVESNSSKQAVVRSLETIRGRPKTVSPESFAEARELADEFKVGTPVVLNLHGIDRELARRLIDFASGVCYCMDGTMEKVGTNVFLLTPESVEITPKDRLRIVQRGYAR